MSNQAVLLSTEEIPSRSESRENRDSFNEYQKSYQEAVIAFSQNLTVSPKTEGAKTGDNDGLLSGIFDFFENLSNVWETFLNKLLSPIFDFINYYKPKFETMLDFFKSTKMLVSDIKEEAIRLTTNFGANNLTGALGWDTDVLSADGYFVKLFKYNFKKLRETISDSMNLTKFFYADSSILTSGSYGSDGVFSKLIKGQITRMADVFKVGIGFYDSPTVASGDSPFIGLIKGQIGRIVSRLETLDTKFYGLFSVGSVLTDSASVSSADGLFSRLLKGQTTRIVTAINNLSDFFRQQFFIYGITANSNESSQDGYFGKMLKYQFSTLSKAIKDVIKAINAVETAVKNIKINVDLGGSGGSVGSGGSDWLETLIKAIGGVLETAIKSVGDVIGKAIENGFNTIDTFLKELGASLRAVTDFLKTFYEKMIELIVPKNMDFVTKDFDSLKVKFKAKFSFFFGWVDTFKGLLGNQKEFSDVTISLKGFFDSSFVLPLSKISVFAHYIKPVFTGFIVLEFLIDMYKWIHRRNEVIE
ncbi:hypothetical protein NXK88_002784 [Enterococcus hirae]|uniref:hypothetical protein n=1 Tax=Enterococcus hirae TaxID=1354 RepID=UPI0020731DAC|nr:hypothetical protein [Enterococcus hirae]EMF0203501.1 hypothetical protein [Enterococcus hirae]